MVVRAIFKGGGVVCVCVGGERGGGGGGGGGGELCLPCIILTPSLTFLSFTLYY